MKAKILYAITLIDQAIEQMESDNEYADECKQLIDIIQRIKMKHRATGLPAFAHTWKKLIARLGEKL